MPKELVKLKDEFFGVNTLIYINAFLLNRKGVEFTILAKTPGNLFRGRRWLRPLWGYRGQRSASCGRRKNSRRRSDRYVFSVKHQLFLYQFMALYGIVEWWKLCVCFLCLINWIHDVWEFTFLGGQLSVSHRVGIPEDHSSLGSLLPQDANGFRRSWQLAVWHEEGKCFKDLQVV